MCKRATNQHSIIDYRTLNQGLPGHSALKGVPKINTKKPGSRISLP